MPELSLEQKVDQLHAIESIKQLKARYCHYCDTGYDADGIASLFTEDGVWDGGDMFGCFNGRETIRAQFAGFSGQILFAAHLVLNPMIEVDGDRAKGRWWLLMPCTARKRDGRVEGRWLVAEYEEDYVRAGGDWKFKKLKIHPKYYAPHLEDWSQHIVSKIASS